MVKPINSITPAIRVLLFFPRIYANQIIYMDYSYIEYAVIFLI